MIVGSVLRGVLKLQCSCLLSGIAPSTGLAVINVGPLLVRCHVSFDYSNFEPGNPYYSLPIRIGTNKLVEGLIVTPTNSAVGEYERVGSFKQEPLWTRKKYRLQREIGPFPLEDARHTQREGELLFASSEGDGGPHVVTIV